MFEGSSSMSEESKQLKRSQSSSRPMAKPSS